MSKAWIDLRGVGISNPIRPRIGKKIKQGSAPGFDTSVARPLARLRGKLGAKTGQLGAHARQKALQHPRDVGAARSLKVLPKRHAINGEASRGIVTHRPYNAAPPPATDWDAPAPYKGNLAMLLQAMIATEDGPAAALAAAMMAETNTPMAELVA